MTSEAERIIGARAGDGIKYAGISRLGVFLQLL
jgi:hypothetical protein